MWILAGLRVCFHGTDYIILWRLDVSELWEKHSAIRLFILFSLTKYKYPLLYPTLWEIRLWWEAHELDFKPSLELLSQVHLAVNKENSHVWSVCHLMEVFFFNIFSVFFLIRNAISSQSTIKDNQRQKFVKIFCFNLDICLLNYLFIKGVRVLLPRELGG